MDGRDLELGEGERLRRFREGVEEAESREVLGFVGWSGVDGWMWRVWGGESCGGSMSSGSCFGSILAFTGVVGMFDPLLKRLGNKNGTPESSIPKVSWRPCQT